MEEDKTPLDSGASTAQVGALLPSSTHWYKLQAILGVGMIVSRLEKEVIMSAAEYILVNMRTVIFTEWVAPLMALSSPEVFHEYKLLPEHKYLPRKATTKE